MDYPVPCDHINGRFKCLNPLNPKEKERPGFAEPGACQWKDRTCSSVDNAAEPDPSPPPSLQGCLSLVQDCNGLPQAQCLRSWTISSYNNDVRCTMEDRDGTGTLYCDRDSTYTDMDQSLKCEQDNRVAAADGGVPRSDQTAAATDGGVPGSDQTAAADPPSSPETEWIDNSGYCTRDNAVMWSNREHDIDGVPLSYTFGTLEECKEKCSSMERCQGFSYDEGAEKCWFTRKDPSYVSDSNQYVFVFKCADP